MQQFKTNRLRLTLRALLLFALTCAAWHPTQAEPAFVLYAPFAESKLRPLTTALAQTLSESANSAQKVVAITDWSAYLVAVRDGTPGIFLVAPHFAAWLIHQHDFTPLARFNDSLSYAVMSRASDHRLFSVRDLRGQVVCTQPNLSLDFLMVSKLLPSSSDPLQIAITGSIAERFQSRDERCSAFAVSEHLAHKMEESSPGEFVRLNQSKQFPQYALVMGGSSRASELESSAEKKWVSQALLDPAVQPLLGAVVAHETGSIELVSTSATDYPAELRDLLIPYWSPP